MRPAPIGKLEVLEYSPDYSASFKMSWDFEVLYRNGEQEIVIGCIGDKEQYVCLKVENKAEFYPSREEWEQASADRSGSNGKLIFAFGEIMLRTMRGDQFWTIVADRTKTRYRSGGEWERRKNEKFKVKGRN